MNMDDRLRVYIVADYEPLRAGLAAAVASCPDLAMAGLASSPEEMTEADTYHDADVIVVDVQTARRTCSQSACHRLREWLPELKVLFLSEPGDTRPLRFENVAWSTQLRSVGFLFKNGPVSRLIQAIRLVAAEISVCEAEPLRFVLACLDLARSGAAPGVAEDTAGSGGAGAL